MSTSSETPIVASEQPYRQWVARVKQLAATVDELAEIARQMRLPPPQASAWHGELFDKLCSQLDEQHPVLVVAVTGGTNTGKSTLFNHLAGSEVSRAEPLASGTKHPVCLLPRGALAEVNGSLPSIGSLGRLFESFKAQAWQSDADPLALYDDDTLIYREDPSGRQPSLLILLDTPDIDSVLRENWHRAEMVRYAADVLVCMLTGQKYNDAAVVDFFRQAAHSDKTIIAVVNFVDWPADESAVRQWLQTFQERTGNKLYAAYALPYDRQAARDHRLKFIPLSPSASDLQTDLAELKFADIKIRSFRGSLKHVLHAQHGLPGFLETIRQHADDYAGARQQLRKLIQVRNIQPPRLPTHLIWNPVWQWLRPKRNAAERMVNGFYSQVGRLLTRPFRRSEADREAEFRRAEWETLQNAVLQILDTMRTLREGRDPILVEALERIVGGDRQRQILAALRADYDALPVQPDGFKQHVDATLNQFAVENPGKLRFLTTGLIASAVVRPVFTVAFMGITAGSELAVHLSTETLIQAAQHTIPTVGFDALVVAGSEVAVQGGGKAAVMRLLNSIYRGYYQQRCEQLQTLLSRHLVGPAIVQIDTLADVPHSPAFARAGQLLAELRRELDE